MQYKRALRRGMSGADVLYIKNLLLKTGSYAQQIGAVQKDAFGADTLRAVLRFQAGSRDTDGVRLKTDGVIGQKTWDAIVAAQPAEATLTLPETVSAAVAPGIAAALEQVSSTRRALVLQALQYAFDPAVPHNEPLSLYIRGGNLYNTDLRLNTITAARIEAGAKRQPAYYSGGRKEMMLAAVKNNPSITGADCSGGVVGLMRHFGLVKPTFDATADALMSRRHSVAGTKDALRAGDWVGRAGHIGLYAGGGCVAEWMGGAYGCQLSRLDARSGWDFVQKKLVKKSGWTAFAKPEYY